MLSSHVPGIIARSLVAAGVVAALCAKGLAWPPEPQRAHARTALDGQPSAGVVQPRDVHAGAPLPSASRVVRHLGPALLLRGDAPARYTLEERMAFYGVPGVSIAIINEGRVESVIAAGRRDVAAGMPADTSTLFQAASISQPVAALTALRLAQSGRLDLDADVNRYLDDWTLPPSRFTVAEKVTARRLLNHTAGLAVWDEPAYVPGSAVPTLPEILSGSARAGTQPVANDTVPGQRWLQSAGGYAVLQLLLEEVTGAPFPSLAHRLALAPLGMRRSTVEHPLPPERLDEAAAGHDLFGRPLPVPRHVHPGMAAAGLWTTAADLARFAIAIQQSARGEPAAPFSLGIATQLLTPDTLLALLGNRWGLGVAIDGQGAKERFAHAGSDPGFRSHLVAFRNAGQGAVVLTNGERGDALIQEILRAIATEYRWPALQPVHVDTVPTDSATAFPLVGRYVNYVSGGDTAFVRLVWADGRLGGQLGREVRTFWAQAGGRFTDPLTSDTFWAEYDAGGRVVALGHVNLWQESVPRRLPRAP